MAVPVVVAVTILGLLCPRHFDLPTFFKKEGRCCVRSPFMAPEEAVIAAAVLIVHSTLDLI